MNTIPFRVVLAAVFFVSFLASGCESQVQIPSTVTPLPSSTPFPPTNTPVPPTPPPTDTPTVPPTATATSTPDRTATEAVNQTATVMAFNEKVYPLLEEVGVIPENGHVAWVQKKDINLTSDSFLEKRAYWVDDLGSVKDFVIRTKVTWNTTGGLALCGVVFRSEEDKTNGANDFFAAQRLQYSPFWSIAYYKFGKFQYLLTGDWISSGAINDENDSTNIMVLVVEGKDITPFFNGEKQRQVQDSKLKEGLIAFAAYQESGVTKCKFQDSWVWVFDK